MNLFEHEDYRHFINGCLKMEKRAGARSRLARAVHCSPSWMTRVLSGHVQLTPDQALATAQYLHLNEGETDYLLLLVERERASTPSLRKRLEGKLEELKRVNRGFATSAKANLKVTEKDTARYYASWTSSAVHVACMIKPMSVEEVARQTKLTPEAVSKILGELKQIGLVSNQGGKWQASGKSIHLSADHPMAAVTHSSWRSHTIHQLQQNAERGLHYSAVHCLSAKDLEQVRKILKDAVLECRSVIEASTSEELAVFCVDWYSL